MSETIENYSETDDNAENHDWLERELAGIVIAVVLLLLYGAYRTIRTIQIGSISSLNIDPATFWGVLLPVAGALIISYLEFYRRKRNQRRRLRKAFLAEIGQDKETLDVSDAIPDGYVPGYTVSTAVFDSAGDLLGELSDAEVEALAEYYSLADNYRWQVNLVVSGDIDEELVRRNMSHLIEAANGAIEAIEDASDLEYEGPSVELEDVNIETGEDNVD